MNKIEFTPAALTRYFRAAEIVVLVLIAVMLIAVSVALLLRGGLIFVTSLQTSQIIDDATNLLDSVLLVMMTMEIVYTVTLQIQIRRLVPEPFLVIGAVSAVRRMLIVTTNASQIPLRDLAEIQNSLLELVVLGFLVLVMVISIYILRKAPPAQPTGPDTDE